jgi:hypothetical protein
MNKIGKRTLPFIALYCSLSILPLEAQAARTQGSIGDSIVARVIRVVKSAGRVLGIATQDDQIVIPKP